MRDKLAAVIGDASEGAGPLKVRRLPIEASQHIADATLEWLREFLGSDEVVERLALFCAANDLDDKSYLTHGWQDYPYPDSFRAFARAALSSIMEQSDGR